MPDRRVSDGVSEGLTATGEHALTWPAAAQKGTGRSLPSWSCRFDPGHPLLFLQLKSHSLAQRTLLRCGAHTTYVPHAAIVTRSALLAPLARRPWQVHARRCPDVTRMPTHLGVFSGSRRFIPAHSVVSRPVMRRPSSPQTRLAELDPRMQSGLRPRSGLALRRLPELQGRHRS
jgi:hypothetical protein